MISIIISTTIILHEWKTISPSPNRPSLALHKPIYIEFLRKNLLAFSDQQLITAIGVQVSAYIKICTISLYHFRIVACLGLLSTVTHFLTLVVLREYFLKRPFLRTLRIVFMVINFILIVNTIIIYLGYNHSTLSLTSLAMCYYRPHGRAPALDVLAPAFFASLGVFVSLGWGIFAMIMRTMSSVAGFFTVWVMVPVYVVTVLVITPIGLSGAQAIVSRSGTTLVPIASGSSEKDWGFGQILPLLLMLLPVLSALEILSGECQWFALISRVWITADCGKMNARLCRM